MQHSQAVLPHHATLTGSALQGSIHYAVPVHDLRINRPHRLPNIKNYNVTPATSEHETGSEQHMQPVPLLQPRKPKRWRKWSSQQQHHTSARPLLPLTVSSTSDVDVLQEYLQQQQKAATTSSHPTVNHWTDRPFPGKRVAVDTGGMLVDQQHKMHQVHPSMQSYECMQLDADEQLIWSTQPENEHLLPCQYHQGSEMHDVSVSQQVTQLYLLPPKITQHDSQGRHLVTFRAYYSIEDTQHWHSVPFLPIQTPSGSQMLLASIPFQHQAHTQHGQQGSNKHRHRHRRKDHTSETATMRVTVVQMQGATRQRPDHHFAPGPDVETHELHVGRSYFLCTHPSHMPQPHTPHSSLHNITPHTVCHDTNNTDAQHSKPSSHGNSNPVPVSLQPLLKQSCMLVVDLAMLAGKQGCRRDDQQCASFRDLWQTSQTVKPSMLVYTSHRSWKWFRQTWRAKQHVLQQPDVLLLSNGTRIMYQAADGSWGEDTTWKAYINRHWDHTTITQAVQSAIDLLDAPAAIEHHGQTQYQHQHQSQHKAHSPERSFIGEYHANIKDSLATIHDSKKIGGSSMNSNSVVLHPEIAQVLFNPDRSDTSVTSSTQQVPLVLHSMLSADHQTSLSQATNADLAGPLNGHSLFCNGYELQHICAGERELVAVGAQRSSSTRTSTILTPSLQSLLDTASIPQRAAVTTVAARTPIALSQRASATVNADRDSPTSTSTCKHGYASHGFQSTGYAGQQRDNSMVHTGIYEVSNSGLNNVNSAISHLPANSRGTFCGSSSDSSNGVTVDDNGRTGKPAAVHARFDTFSEQNSSLVRVLVKRTSLARFEELVEQQLDKLLRAITHHQQGSPPVPTDASALLSDPLTHSNNNASVPANHSYADSNNHATTSTSCSTSSAAAILSYQHGSSSPATAETAVPWEVVVMDSQGLGLERGYCIVDIRPRRAGAGNALRYLMNRFGITPNKTSCPIVANMAFPQPDLQAACTHAVVYEKGKANWQHADTSDASKDIQKTGATQLGRCKVVTTDKWGAAGIVDGLSELQLL